jgi:hypothetical protein
MNLLKLKQQIDIHLELMPKYADYEVIIRVRDDISDMKEDFLSSPLEAFSADFENKEFCLWIHPPTSKLK